MKKASTIILGILLSISTCISAQSLNQEKLDKAFEIASQFFSKQQIPGMAVSISHQGKLIWSKGFGYSNLKLSKKVVPSKTQFRIASISKTITAFAMATLVDDKKLNFAHSVYTYVPDFPKKKYDFTIKQIAGHTAGIRHYKSNEFLMNTKMSIVAGLDIFKNDALLFKPGSRFSYSTYGWNLLSVVVQNAAKKEFNEYMSKAVFNPLKMNQTSLDFSDKEMPNRTSFYVKQHGKIIIAPAVSNEFKAAGGGFVSTSEDLVKFGDQFIKPSIVSKKVINQMVTPLKLLNGKKTKYGIGIGVLTVKNNTLRYSHSGGGMGASTFLLVYPKKELVISVLTNLSGVNIRKLVTQLEEVFID